MYKKIIVDIETSTFLKNMMTVDQLDIEILIHEIEFIF